MKFTHEQGLARLQSSDHGILCTLHAERGPDAVPVAFALDDGFIAIPIDLVKPKDSTRLQRERNLEADPRATLLVEQWDPEDWSQLWWVRATLKFHANAPQARQSSLADILETRYPQYRGQPFARVLVLQVLDVTGWAASA